MEDDEEDDSGRTKEEPAGCGDGLDRGWEAGGRVQAIPEVSSST